MKYCDLISRLDKQSKPKKKKKIKIIVKPTEKIKKSNKTTIKNLSRKLARELKKDLQYCEQCGSIEKLQVHHIDRNALNNTLNNLIKLCFVCHIQEHKDEPVYRIMKKRLSELQ